jgi:hypothetical protein
VLKILCSLTLSALLAFPVTAQTNPGSAQPSAAPSALVGCVQKTGDVYTVTDETSKTTVQLRGGNLRKGRHVEVTGAVAPGVSPAKGATEVFDVTGVKYVSGSCRTNSANGGSSYSPSGAKRATVVSILVIGAVAAGAAVATIRRQGEAR